MSDTTKTTPLPAERIAELRTAMTRQDANDDIWLNEITSPEELLALIAMLTPVEPRGSAEEAWRAFWEKRKLPDEAFIAPGYAVADDIAEFAEEYARAPRLTVGQREAVKEIDASGKLVCPPDSYGQAVEISLNSWRKFRAAFAAEFEEVEG